MERGSAAYLAALAKPATLINCDQLQNEKLTVGGLRSLGIWSTIHSKSRVTYLPASEGRAHTIKRPVQIELSDADVEVLALSMEKDTMMTVIGGASALMSLMLHEDNIGSQPAPSCGAERVVRELERQGPLPADKTAKEAVEALRPGSAAEGRNPVELLREVPLWDELFRARLRWTFRRDELSALSHVLTAREAVEIIRAVHNNIAELGNTACDRQVVSALFK